MPVPGLCFEVWMGNEKKHLAAAAESRSITLPTVLSHPSLGSDESFNLEGKAVVNICK